MWRVGVVTKKGDSIAQNFSTKDEADLWVLDQAEKKGIKKAIIINKKTNEREVLDFEEEKKEKPKDINTYHSLSQQRRIRIMRQDRRD